MPHTVAMSSAGRRPPAPDLPAGDTLQPHAVTGATLQPQGGDTQALGGFEAAGFSAGWRTLLPPGCLLVPKLGTGKLWSCSAVGAGPSSPGHPTAPKPPTNRCIACRRNRGAAGPLPPRQAKQPLGKPRHRVGMVVDLGSDTRVREELRAELVVLARFSHNGDAVGAGPCAGHAEPATALGGGDAETWPVVTREGRGCPCYRHRVHPQRLHPS